MNEDFYATLGVAATASDAEIERAYRRLARASHPDLLRHAPAAERHAAEERLKAINRAHHSLGDRERRRDYDRQRRQTLSGARLTPPGARHPASTGARPVRAGGSRPVVARTVHRVGGESLDIEWTTAPPIAARPVTDLFTVGRLLRYALLIIVFAVLLGLLWHPNVAPQLSPTPAPGATATIR